MGILRNAHRRIWVGMGLALALAATVEAASRQTPAVAGNMPADAQLQRRDCYIMGLSRAVECVTLRVPLDWDAPQGSTIEVSAVVIPAVGERRADPLFVLPGGPGQGASQYGTLVPTAFGEVRKHRDLVLVDPRGTGMSTPFNCDMALAAAGPLTADQRTEIGSACAAQAPADPRFFTAREVVEDLNRVRDALGYGSINLWGGSWGTRLAQFYITAHGDRVRAAIFDGPVPTANLMIATAGPDAGATTDALYARCAEDEACAARFPRGKEQLVKVLTSFESSKSLRFLDPLTDTVANVEFNRDAVTEILRGALYVPTNAALLPFIVDALSRGDPGPLAAVWAETAGWSMSTQQMGVLMAVMCSEEAAEFVARTPELPSTALSLFGDGYSRFFLDYCRAWPSRPLPAALRYPSGMSPVPALVLSGAMDPVAGPERGEELAARFTTHVTLVVRNGGHINSTRGCAPRLLAAFLEDPGANVDGSCLDDIAWPPFALSPLGPIALR